MNPYKKVVLFTTTAAILISSMCIVGTLYDNTNLVLTAIALAIVWGWRL